MSLWLSSARALSSVALLLLPWSLASALRCAPLPLPLLPPVFGAACLFSISMIGSSSSTSAHFASVFGTSLGSGLASSRNGISSTSSSESSKWCCKCAAAVALAPLASPLLLPPLPTALLSLSSSIRFDSCFFTVMTSSSGTFGRNEPLNGTARPTFVPGAAVAPASLLLLLALVARAADLARCSSMLRLCSDSDAVVSFKTSIVLFFTATGLSDAANAGSSGADMVVCGRGCDGGAVVEVGGGESELFGGACRGALDGNGTLESLTGAAALAAEDATIGDASPRMSIGTVAFALLPPEVAGRGVVVFASPGIVVGGARLTSGLSFTAAAATDD